MAADLLKYEDFEGMFDGFLAPPPNLYQGTRYAIYQAAKKALLCPNVRNWKAYVVGLAIAFAVLNILLYYQQHRSLSRRTTRPKPLQSAISQHAFTTKQANQRKVLKFACIRSLYRLLVQFLLVSTGVLQWLWPGIEKATKEHEVLRRAAAVFEVRLGHTVNTLLFYVFCALLWTVCMLPVTYYESFHLTVVSQGAAVGEGGGRAGKPTVRAWLSGIAWAQGETLLLIWSLLYFAEGDLLWFGVDSTLDTGFFVLLGRPLWRALVLVVLAVWPIRGVIPLRDGNTKTAMERMAREEGVRLAGIYCSAEGRTEAGEELEVKLYGLPWKRSVVLSEKILGRCNSEEVVALTAFEFGNSRHAPILGFITNLTYHWARSLCFLVLLFNWRAVCESFGFGTEFSYFGQHPFLVIILTLGGAIDPLFEATDALDRALDNKFESDADKLAVKKGYGQHLAKAIIKLGKDDLEAIDVSEAYCHVRANEQNLQERLRRLGWTGEEEIPEEKGKQYYHWESE